MDSTIEVLVPCFDGFYHGIHHEKSHQFQGQPLFSQAKKDLEARRISVKELKLWVFFWLEGLDLIGRDIFNIYVGLVANIMNDRGDVYFWDIESESPLGISSFFCKEKLLLVEG